jgi:two-component system nitrate/nitrite response regulator NarL
VGGTGRWQTDTVDLRGRTVLVVDDHRLFADALVVALRQFGWLAINASADLTRTGLIRVAEATRPDIVLLDVDLGHGGPAIEVVADFAALGAWVLAVTDGHDRYLLAEALEAGVSGVVDKSDSLERVVQLVHDTAAGMAIFPPSVRSELLSELADRRAADRARTAPFDRLSPRERQVLALLMTGKSPDEIATVRFVSVTTVRTQVRNILQKLGVNSQLAAVGLARRAGWDPADGSFVTSVHSEIHQI